MSELVKIRRSRGLSQRALARVADMSPSSIYEIETGRRKPNPSTLRKLAVALGVEVVDLLEEEERPKATAPKTPKEWLRAHGGLLLSLTEEGLSDIFAALYPDDRETFANRMDKEWRDVDMASRLADDPNAPLVREAYAHAQSRYLQGTTLAPIATSYDPDDPEKPERVPVPLPEDRETPARSGRKDRNNTG